MEHRLLADVVSKPGKFPILSPKFTDAALSLISNPFTSEQSLTSLLETLVAHLQNPEINHAILFSLLSALSNHHPRLRRRISAAAHAFVLLPTTATPTLPHALSLIEPAELTPFDPFSDESMFLSLCFWQCVKTRRWTLRNVSKFHVRPSVFLTVLLGLTKDPYPYIREAALDGLVMLSNGGIVVDDRSLIECCYFRSVELLFDAENSVRCSAVRAVSEWGQLLVALSPDKTKADWSDGLFVQLCLMVRDREMEIRVAAFSALGNIRTVSEDILMLTLAKKALSGTNEKTFPGQYTAKLFKLPATAAVFTFVNGLEDEFYQVRKSACHAVKKMTVLSAKFAGEVVYILMQILNEDSVVVRLQALETLHHMAMHDHLKVEESHLDMFFGALVDGNALIRSAARKTIQLTKFQKLAMFRSCIDVLIKNLELCPQDEADVFYALYKIGRSHGKFVTKIIHEVSQELEPSPYGKLGFTKVRTIALLVLAISAPVSLERQISTIRPEIYSYAVTLLGRLTRGLGGLTDQNALLDYLSHCSRFTVGSTSESFGEVLDFHLKDSYFQLQKRSETTCVEIVFQKIVDLWPLIQLGCMNEVIRTLRSWKEELQIFSLDSRLPAGVLVFALKYLHVIKLLGKAWACYFSTRNLHFNGIGILEALLCKMERRLKEMLHRFTGLSRGVEMHILELMLVTYTLRLSYRGGTIFFEDYTSKFNSVFRRVENLGKEESIEPFPFLIDLQSISHEIGNSRDGFIHKPELLQKSLNLFSLKQIVVSEKLDYLDAEIDVFDNDFQNPLPFISGLPVGIPFDITLHNISLGTRLWLAITDGEKSTQFVFLDLHEFGGCNEIRKSAFVAPFFRTPKVKHSVLKVSVVMECLSEGQHSKHLNEPKQNFIYLSKGKEIHLSTAEK
ncbi:hypothetical protein ABFX02_10G009000 [Erythranthe guttata]